MESNLNNGMLGLAVGDALGVPVEGVKREDLRSNPVTGFRGYEVHNQKAGTWSDATATAMCTLDSLCNGIDYEDNMQKFVKWKCADDYTAHEEVFRIDPMMKQALEKFGDDVVAEKCGAKDENNAEYNGCGSLVRMFPLAFYQESTYSNGLFRELTDEEMDQVHNFCGLTHQNLQCKIACGLYVCVARELLTGSNPAKIAIINGLKRGFAYYDARAEYAPALANFMMLRNMEVLFPEGFIKTDSSAVDVLTAAIWCVMKTATEVPGPDDRLEAYTAEQIEAAKNINGYKEIVLRAVNLGGDTVDIAAVAGSLAGIIYGYVAIPEEWKEQLAMRVWIEDICRKFTDPVKNASDNEDAIMFEHMVQMNNNAAQ